MASVAFEDSWRRNICDFSNRGGIRMCGTDFQLKLCNSIINLYLLVKGGQLCADN